MPKGPRHLLQSAEGAEVGVWGVKPGREGSLTYAQPQPQPELQSKGKKGVSLEVVRKGRVEVVLARPLFWARPMSGSLSCFLPDLLSVRHGVATPMSQGVILPQLHVNEDHRLKYEDLLGVGGGCNSTLGL